MDNNANVGSWTKISPVGLTVSAKCISLRSINKSQWICHIIPQYLRIVNCPLSISKDVSLDRKTSAAPSLFFGREESPGCNGHRTLLKAGASCG